LQGQFKAQKFAEFKEERAFMMDMAKMYTAEKAQQFSQMMQLANYELDTYRLALQEQEMYFNQQMRVADYNLRASQVAYDQWYKNEQLQISRDRAKFEKDMYIIEQGIAAAQSKIRAESQRYAERVDDLDWAIKRLEEDGIASNPAVQQILGLTATDNAYTGRVEIANALMEADTWKNSIMDRMTASQMDEELYGFMTDWSQLYNEMAVQFSETYDITDASGAVIGTSRRSWEETGYDSQQNSNFYTGLAADKPFDPSPYTQFGTSGVSSSSRSASDNLWLSTQIGR